MSMGVMSAGCCNIRVAPRPIGRVARPSRRKATAAWCSVSARRTSVMDQIHIIHENPEWLPPLAEALDARGLPWSEWFMHNRTFDLGAPPPEGVFYNRMSASSHTRGHRFSAELTACVLA